MYTIQNSFKGFTVKLTVETALTRDEELMLQRAVYHAAKKLGSGEFTNFCKSYFYTYKVKTSGFWFWAKYTTRTEHNFKHSLGRTSEEVYHHLMEAREALGYGTDRVADITLVVDRRNKRSVVGYTYPNSVKQWVYSWVLRTNYKRVAGNLVHEWCHKMGYDHAFRYNSTRKHSVPYAVGDFVAEIQR